MTFQTKVKVMLQQNLKVYYIDITIDMTNSDICINFTWNNIRNY